MRTCLRVGMRSPLHAPTPAFTPTATVAEWKRLQHRESDVFPLSVAAASPRKRHPVVRYAHSHMRLRAMRGASGARSVVTVQCVRGHVADSMSSRDCAKDMAGRGAAVAPPMVHCGVNTWLPIVVKATRGRLPRVGGRWRMDAPDMRVTGQWQCLSPLYPSPTRRWPKRAPLTLCDVRAAISPPRCRRWALRRAPPPNPPKYAPAPSSSTSTARTHGASPRCGVFKICAMSVISGLPASSWAASRPCTGFARGRCLPPKGRPAPC